MTRAEYDSVIRYVESSSDRARTEAVMAQDKTVSLGDGIFVIMCRYKDMIGGCAVYPARPLICRLLGHVEWMPCPIEKVKHIAKTSDALELMSAYSKEDRRTFEQWDNAGGTT